MAILEMRHALYFSSASVGLFDDILDYIVDDSVLFFSWSSLQALRSQNSADFSWTPPTMDEFNSVFIAAS